MKNEIDQNPLQVITSHMEDNLINISIGNIGNIEITRYGTMVTKIRILNYNDINNPDAEPISTLISTLYVHDDEFDCSDE